MYFKPTELKVYADHSAIRADYPEVSLPAVLSESLLSGMGIFPVGPSPQPIFDPATQRVDSALPVLQDAAWVEGWEVVELSDAEKTEVRSQQIHAVNAQRATLLSESDWTQLPDVPMSTEERGQWAAYRQALRDITLQPSYPWVVWPEKPTAGG